MTRLAAALGALLAGAAASAARGEAPADPGARAFQKCVSCHSVDRGEGHVSGPNLAGVVGRRAGALGGYAYSPALRRAGERGLVWTAEILDRYIADPEAVVPGTTMNPPPLRDPAERRAIVEYLKRVE